MGWPYKAAVNTIVASLSISACTPAKWHETKSIPKPPPGLPAQAQRTALPATQPMAPAPVSQPVIAPSGVPTGVPQPQEVNPVITRKGTPDAPPQAPGVASKETQPPAQSNGPNVPCAIDEAAQPAAQPGAQTSTQPGPEGNPEPVVTAPAPPPAPKTELPAVNSPAVSNPVADADRFLVIENIATGKLRVYEACLEANCPHRLILETDMMTGEDRPEQTRRSILGSFKITKWFKFYQDHQALYPSWFNETYPSLPPAGSDITKWASKSLLPLTSKAAGKTTVNANGKAVSKGKSNGKSTETKTAAAAGARAGLLRGSFGWYTAYLGPNAGTQWLHGTLGWGADEDRFVHLTRDQLSQYYSDPRGYGCTRVENRAIAYLQQILPVGTRVIKVYAREIVSDPYLTRFADAKRVRWNWILTKDGVSENITKSGQNGQLARGILEGQVLEHGSYILDRYPDVVELGPKIASGNLYELDHESIKGYFVIDSGRFIEYEHPRELRVGGIPGEVLPEIVMGQRPDPTIAITVPAGHRPPLSPLAE
jgi:hypothetical protein